MARSVLGNLIAIALLPVTAAAQHAPVGSEECGMCHGPHGGAPGAYNLKATDVAVWLRPGTVGGLSVGSRSCLRCHLTESVRAQQPEAVQGTLLHSESAHYLGFDLSQHHPLGMIDNFRRPEALRRSQAARRSTPFLTAENERIKCTTCHSAHARTGSKVDPREEAALCGRCHDAGSYLIGHGSLACSDCHQLHRATEGPLLGPGPAADGCRSCHDPAAAARPAAFGQPVPAPRAHALEAPRRQADCLTCHGVHSYR